MRTTQGPWTLGLAAHELHMSEEGLVRLARDLKIRIRGEGDQQHIAGADLERLKKLFRKELEENDYDDLGEEEKSEIPAGVAMHTSDAKPEVPLANGRASLADLPIALAAIAAVTIVVLIASC